MKIYVDNSKDINTKNYGEMFSFGNEHKYGYVVIKPSKYKKF